MKYFVLASFALSLSRFRLGLLEALKATGGAVHVAAPGLLGDKPVLNELARVGCHCHEVPLARTGLNPVKDAATFLALLILLRRERPTHFLGYTAKPVIYGLLAAWLAGVPRRTALITGLGYLFGTNARGLRGLVQRLAWLMYRAALGRATAVVFQNPDDRDLFIRRRLVDPRKTAIVNGSGVPLDQFPARPLPPANQCHFLLIARLLRDKGIYEYIEAARRIKTRYPHAAFHLVGWMDSNPLSIREEDLRMWIAEGLIHFHGRLDDVRERLAACHVYVLPSYREGTPRSVLEAMATGRAVVTTDAPGCRETVINGDNGFLVKVADAQALADAMTRFLIHPELIDAMGARSREIAERKYDVAKVNSAMLRYMGVQTDAGAAGAAPLTKAA
jgi:glycosyltransferase involved in cell wall biosynthesis